MLLLLHGQILAFIPALFLLGFAGLLLVFLVKNKIAERNRFLSLIITLILIASGIFGLIFLFIFLDESWYWLKYSF